jgi:cell division septum initiation protein DivIVA
LTPSLVALICPPTGNQPADKGPVAMSEKSSFLNWVGFKGEETNAPGSVDRIRELEAQLADLRSRRDITALSKEEFEILATETAMTIIKSAQLREAKAQALADRVFNDTARQTKDALENAEQKAKSLLSGAETRGRKYLQAAETEAQELREKIELEAETLLENKKREATHLTTTARREGERIIGEATHDIREYRQWLSGVISEAERLYKVQVQSLDAAESAIHQSRTRLESSFLHLAQLQKSVIDSLNADDTVVKDGPIKIASERTKPAIDAPGKPVKKVVKKATVKRK